MFTATAKLLVQEDPSKSLLKDLWQLVLLQHLIYLVCQVAEELECVLMAKIGCQATMTYSTF